MANRIIVRDRGEGRGVPYDTKKGIAVTDAVEKPVAHRYAEVLNALFTAGAQDPPSGCPTLHAVVRQLLQDHPLPWSVTPHHGRFHVEAEGVTLARRCSKTTAEFICSTAESVVGTIARARAAAKR